MKTKIQCDPIVDRKYAYLTLRYGWCDTKGYARGEINGKMVFLHRMIMEIELGRKLKRNELIDHINKNPLDNRVCNLRITDYIGNAQNRKVKPFRGSYETPSGKYQAQICYRGKRICLGTYISRKEATKVAANKRKELQFLS